MRHLSCEILEENDKYNQKIKVISNRMSNLEKDIQKIKMRNISPFLTTKNSTKSFTINFDKKENKIHYISNSNHNLNNINKKEGKIHYISNSNSNSHYLHNLENSNIYKNYCQYSLRNTKQKYFSLNSSNINFYNNHIRKNNNKTILSKEELEYEFEIRTLKRKLGELKKKNEKINNKLSLLKEKNDNLECNLNSYRNTYETINDNENDNEERKNRSINDQINAMKYKRKLIDKVMDVFKRNIFVFSFISNKKRKEDYSILNMLLNLMEMKFVYENSILNDAFLLGVDLLYQTNFPKYPSIKRKDKIFLYTKNLFSHQRKLEMEIHKYDNIKKYYILYQKFAGIKNLNEFLNKIIVKNIKVDKKIDKIKLMLNFEEENKGKEKENENGSYRSKIIKNFLQRNQNKSFNYDLYSFYTTNYNNKVSHYNNKNYSRNNNYLKYGKNTDRPKYNNFLKISENNKSNFAIYNKNKDKNSLMKNEKLKSKSLNKKISQKIL